MREKILNLLGLMRRANAVSIGETNTGAAARSGKAKLLLLAADASDNARKRAEGFAAGQSLDLVRLPFTKAEISAHVGVNGCSMAAVMDLGFADALMKNLAALLPGEYGPAAERIAERCTKERERRKVSEARERNKRIGKRRNSV